MRKLCLIAVMALITCLVFACTESGDTQPSTDIPEPQQPATPLPPKANDRTNQDRPATAKPADTPEPAATAIQVATPLAVLPSYTPEPSPTVVPVPTTTPVSAKRTEEIKDENIQRCLHWALQNLKPIEFSRFEQLDPYGMTDLERILWGEMIERPRSRLGGFWFAKGSAAWCADYWSEPLTEENINKRNEQYKDGCDLSIVSQASKYEKDVRDGSTKSAQNDYSIPPIMVNQYIRIMNWMDISGEDLLNMDEPPIALVERIFNQRDEIYSDEYKGRYNLPKENAPSDVVEWWRIEEAWFDFVDPDDYIACGWYYPQLFFGRWMPMDDYEIDEKFKKAAEHLRELRQSDDWPEWADQKNRDVLIRLEN